MINLWILIILLSISTFVSRILGVEMMAKREVNPTLQLYFSYVPIAIMAALIMKQIIIPTTSGQLIISFPVLFGALATGISIKVSKLFLPSVIIGMIVGLLVRKLFYSS